MKKQSEAQLVTGELRELFVRASNLFRVVQPKHRYNARSNQVRADVALTRFCNELRRVAGEFDDAREAEDREAAESECTRGKEFCFYHQGQCGRHFNLHPDERCTCWPCLPPKD